MNFSCYQENGKSNGSASRREDRQTDRQIMHGRPAPGPAQPSFGHSKFARQVLGIPVLSPSHSPCQTSPFLYPVSCLLHLPGSNTTQRDPPYIPDPSIAHPISLHASSCIPEPTAYIPSPIPSISPPISHIPHSKPSIPHPTWSLAWPLTLLRGSLTMWDLLLEIILGKRRRKRRRVRKGGPNLPQDCWMLVTPQDKGDERVVPQMPGCPPPHPVSRGMWSSGRDKGQWERAAAPSALPLQEGMRQGVQLVHLLLDLQVGPLAEARGGAGGSPSTHPATGRWRSAPKCHSRLGSHTLGVVTWGHGGVGPRHAPGSSPGWT